MRLQLAGVFATALSATACQAPVPDAEPQGVQAPESTTAAALPAEFAAVPESAWVAVNGPTLVAFYPLVSNDSLEADQGLATALDDLAYHIGTAMDSLMAAGFMVQYRGGDTLWLRMPREHARVVRDADSAIVGYVFADSLGRRAMIYGVRSHLDLVEYAHEFRRTGSLRPR
jgi:hypothetical protein